MKMELRHLRYLVAVVREGSVTRAAKKLNMAQPPLSRQIHQLEEELGVVLLERGTRPLRLTDAGQFFYEHALSLLDRVEAVLMMTRRVGQFEHGQQGRFGIGFVGSILYGPLPTMVRRFHAAHPDLQVDLLELTIAWCTDHGCGRTAPSPVRVRRRGRNSAGPGPACD